MNENSTLFWSSFSLYEKCPQRFLWSRGWEDIDLGAGPGKPKPVTQAPTPRHHAVMGTVIQYAIERMYNDELYKDPKALVPTLMGIVDLEWERQEADSRNHMDYREMELTRSEMLQHCRDAVLNYLKTMKAHRFIGPYAKAEVGLVGWIDKYTQIGGRADVIIRRDDTGITILDGKNSKRKDPDPDQLRWYALLFKLSYKELPARIGFVWYRFPFDAENGETGLDWIPFTELDLEGIAQRVVQARLDMRKRKFQPTPSPPDCKYCEYELSCEARQTQRAANAARRKPKEEQPRKTPKPDMGPDGFGDLFL